MSLLYRDSLLAFICEVAYTNSLPPSNLFDSKQRWCGGGGGGMDPCMDARIQFVCRLYSRTCMRTRISTVHKITLSGQ